MAKKTRLTPRLVGVWSIIIVFLVIIAFNRITQSQTPISAESSQDPVRVAPTEPGIAGPGIPNLGPGPSQAEIPGQPSPSKSPQPNSNIAPEQQPTPAPAKKVNCSMRARLLPSTDTGRIEITINGVFESGVSFVRLDWGATTTYRQVDASDGNTVVMVPQPEAKPSSVIITLASQPSFGADVTLCQKTVQVLK